MSRCVLAHHARKHSRSRKLLLTAGVSTQLFVEQVAFFAFSLSAIGACVCNLGRASLTRKFMRWVALQIPHIVSAVDFDPKEPEHLRVFEEEMTEMMSDAIRRQQVAQRVRDVTKPSAKLSLRELELAKQGFDVKLVRDSQAMGATCFYHHKANLHRR
jgi:hypothetical protein